MTTQLLIYETAVPVSSGRHGKASIEAGKGYGFARKINSVPLTAVEHGTSLTRVLGDVERGRRLFVAKGCVTCHEQIGVGPNLTGKRFDVAYISTFIANPPSTPSRQGGSPMPNLGLQQREVTSLVAYLNSDRQVLESR